MEQFITIPNKKEEIKIEVIDTDSRIISFFVREDLTVELHVPLDMDQKLIDQYIESHKKEFVEKYEEATRRDWERIPSWEVIDGRTSYQSGVILPFLGKSELILRVKRNFIIKGTTIYPKKESANKQYLIIETDDDSLPFIRYCVVNYYKKCAMALVDLRLKHLADIMGLTYEDVKIMNGGSELRISKLSKFIAQNVEVREQQTVWGSCTKKKYLKFDWKIAMLPMEIVEYIFVHELAHLRRKHHSNAFWEDIRRVMPNYQMCRTWLEIHGKEYEIY